MAIIEAQELTKRYGDLVAVDRLNLQIEEGEVFGLLGPNGAGKTTTVLMLLGLTEPTSGQARVAGYDPTREPIAVKRVVGYLPDNVGFYEDLTAWQNLAYTADLNGLSLAETKKRIAEVLERVGLADVAHKRAGTFSRGMRQRLGIADVLLKQPRVVILDEPTIGLDPEAIVELLDFIRQLARDERMTVLVSSHQLQQVQRICDRVGIFSRGKLIAQGSIDQLSRQLFGSDLLVVEIQVRPLNDHTLNVLRGVAGVERVEPSSDGVTLSLARDVRPELVRTLVGQGIDVLGLHVRGSALEEIYLKYFKT
jgi:ABC-2 type transport system ATP-binding protein